MEESKYIELAIAFLSGIVITFVSAYISKHLQSKYENNKRRKEVRFKIYMELLNIQSLYFWFTTAELHNEEVPTEIKDNARKSSWKIADLLRENEGLELQAEILDVLFNEGYEFATVRSNRLEELITKLGQTVNPKYKETISRISKENPKHLFERGMVKSNAPGSFR